MADRRRRARLRTALGWALTLAIVAYSITDWGDGDDDRIAATAGDGDGDAELRIRMISDAEVSPGDAVVVRFDNADDDLAIGARISGEAATILDRRAHSLVVRVPDATPTGARPSVAARSRSQIGAGPRVLTSSTRRASVAVAGPRVSRTSARRRAHRSSGGGKKLTPASMVRRTPPSSSCQAWRR